MAAEGQLHKRYTQLPVLVHPTHRRYETIACPKNKGLKLLIPLRRCLLHALLLRRHKAMGYSVRTNSDQTKHALFSMNSITRGEMKYVQSITASFRAFALHSWCSNVTANLPDLNNCGLPCSRAFRPQFDPFRSAESGYAAHTAKCHLFAFSVRSNRLCKHGLVAAPDSWNIVFLAWPQESDTRLHSAHPPHATTPRSGCPADRPRKNCIDV
jgi:hypothetical protein